MTQPGYQQGGERAWWWKVAQHVDAAQLATVNAIAHNVDDPTLILAFHETLRQGQAILLEIFRVKGLLPTAVISPPPPAMSAPPMEVPPMQVPPMHAPAGPEDGLSIPGALPLSIGIPAFSFPSTPPGVPSMADPPPPPPSPVQELSEVVVPVESAPVVAPDVLVTSSPEVFDYGDDAGKGFENQDAKAEA